MRKIKSYVKKPSVIDRIRNKIIDKKRINKIVKKYPKLSSGILSNNNKIYVIEYKNMFSVCPSGIWEYEGIKTDYNTARQEIKKEQKQINKKGYFWVI